MNKILRVSKLFISLSVLFVICFSSIFPSCSVSTANLSGAKLCSSLSGTECGADALSFPVDVPVIYCSASVNNAPSQTKVLIEWKHGSESLGTMEKEVESGYIHATLKPNSTLAPGQYSVTMKIASDNSTPLTKEFTLE